MPAVRRTIAARGCVLSAVWGKAKLGIQWLCVSQMWGGCFSRHEVLPEMRSENVVKEPMFFNYLFNLLSGL